MAIVIGMMNKKGGAGKSTITKLLASAIVHSGHSCLIIDLDPNRDILRWWETATEQGNHDPRLTVRATLAADDLFDIVGQHDDRVRFILIDTKGEGESWAEDLASVVDRLVVPCMNAKSDRDRTRETLAWHRDLLERAEDPAQVPPLHVVLTRVPRGLVRYRPGAPKPEGMTARDLARHNEIVREFRPLATMVPERSQYGEMDEQGLLGNLMEKARAGDWKDKGQALHYESALAHAIDLMNNILDGRRMEDRDAA